jgi:hypothetical protein
MRKLSAILALGGMLAICAAQVNAQQISTVPDPLTIFAAPGTSFQVTFNVSNSLGFPTFTFGAIPIEVIGVVPGFSGAVVHTTAAPTAGQALTYFEDPSTPANPITGGSSEQIKVNFQLGVAPSVVNGAYNIQVRANNTNGFSPSGAFGLIVATPEYGSVFSLGGLLLAGGTGLWVRRRRSGKAKTEAS